uniref:Uncharacterized protein n=1 Tax=Candidatus Kentrum eta TaxID=2126337 RepID=A0A450VHW3_9GAMM|nr:MAG: hypothetical protein BECKH772A_GA0070896_104123 [Candidatus Kentron sp. H]VFK07391.1 MAG: hypothetical protein BECKH772C_GA0070978_104173 [Candidatus Kentron sp. H]
MLTWEDALAFSRLMFAQNPVGQIVGECFQLSLSDTKRPLHSGREHRFKVWFHQGRVSRGPKMSARMISRKYGSAGASPSQRIRRKIAFLKNRTLVHTPRPAVPCVFASVRPGWLGSNEVSPQLGPAKIPGARICLGSRSTPTPTTRVECVSVTGRHRDD